MKNTENFILMADIVDSQIFTQNQLMNSFSNLCAKINEKLKDKFASPITITLGDEFQSVVTSWKSGVEIIFALEEEMIYLNSEFSLRYVLIQGKIETPINPTIAYGMLGPGLTRARQCLQELKKSTDRFYFEGGQEKKMSILNNLFIVYQSIKDVWSIEKDYPIVKEFLEDSDYKKVAKNLKKDTSQIWKREKSLKIHSFLSLKSAILLVLGS